MEFYQHSGRCGQLGVPLAAAAAALTGLVLGLVYAYFTNWVPFIYLNFFATAAFGAGVGAAVAWGAKVGKIRNMFIATALSATMGVVALYFAWVFDPMARFAEVTTPVWDTQTLRAYMKLGYEEGFWNIGGGEGAVKGVFLAIVWALEAAMVIGVAAFTTLAMLGHQPYCEETGQWTKTEKGVARLSLVDDHAQVKLERLMAGDLQVLREFYRAADEDPSVLRLDLATAEGCSLCNFLTITAIQTTVDKKGETSTQENSLLTNLQVAEEDLPQVREAGTDRPPEPVAAQGTDGEDHPSAGDDALQT